MTTTRDHVFAPAFDGSDFCTNPGCRLHRTDHELFAETPTYPDVEVKLIGHDGNAFVIIGAVSRAISRAHGAEAADAWRTEATQCGSYDELLRFVMSTVEVS